MRFGRFQLGRVPPSPALEARNIELVEGGSCQSPGIVPSKRHSESPNIRSELGKIQGEGRGPPSLFLISTKFCKLSGRPSANCCGMVPVSWLFATCAKHKLLLTPSRKMCYFQVAALLLAWKSVRLAGSVQAGSGPESSFSESCSSRRAKGSVHCSERRPDSALLLSQRSSTPSGSQAPSGMLQEQGGIA